MSTPEEARERLVESFLATVKKYADLSIDSVTRPDLGNELDFQSLRPSIERIQGVCRALAETPVEILAARQVRTGNEAFDQLEPRLNELTTFNVVALAQQNANPVQTREKYLAEYAKAEDRFWQHITPLAAFLLSEKVRRSPETSGGAAEEVISAATAALSEATTSKDELKAIVEASRQAVADLGVTKHAGLFAQEAQDFAEEASGWLKATIGAATLTVLGVGANVWYTFVTPPDTNDPVHIQLIVAKVLAFSLLISGTLWCGRMYRAARHNWVINRHRQNALGTFQTFVQGASDPATKDTILLHAAQSIFQVQPPGYTAGEAEAANPSQLIEVVRTMNPQAKT